MATRKKITPAPVVLTPEQIEAQARRSAALDAHASEREDLLRRAQVIAERLCPGRVFGRQICDGFGVTFGDPEAPRLSFCGPGTVEMCVELNMFSRLSGSDDFAPPSLRFLPRAYSLGYSDGIESAEAQGRALIEAAQFARTLLALLA